MDVAVLAGGPSAEHEVSLQSGANMIALLRGGGQRVRPAFIDRDNRWTFRGTGEELAAPAPGAPGLSLEEALAELRRSREIACLALHGRFGEDGRLQRRLEDLGLPFTGSGSHASAIGMDKELSKHAAIKVGARTAPHEVVSAGGATTKLARQVGLPCFVKPVRGGSSVGVSRVREAGELQAAVARAAAEDERGQVLVEAAIEGVEVTCAVLRLAGQLRCLPLVAIRPAGETFYDYHAKYVAEDTQLQCPAAVPPGARDEIERVSTALFAALELRGVVRFDFILRPDGTPVFLELNTLPGFTGHSLVPLAARAAGLSPLAVLEACLQDALAAAGGTALPRTGTAT
jgi:D-alanine-D-alanine ligase